MKILSRYKMFTNEKTKNIFIVIAIWWTLSVIMALMGELWKTLPWAFGYKDALYSFIFAPIGSFIVFLPTIILLYFLFKKIKNYYARVILTAFLIPFTNMIYFFIEGKFLGESFFSMIIGFFTLCGTLPIVSATALCCPKSILPFKWYIILTNFLMAVLGWIMILICFDESVGRVR